MKTEGELRRRGKRDEPKLCRMSDKTADLYWKAVSSFCSWAVASKRLDTHPLAGVRRKRKGEATTTFSRRALTADELGRLVAAAKASTRKVHKLTGEQRAYLWLFQAATGLRCHETSSVTPRSFDWDSPPTVVISSKVSKRRKTDVIELPVALADQLREWIADKPADEPVWGGLWWQRGAETLRHDLFAAGIDPVDEDGKVVDAHSLRTTAITAICSQQISLPLALRISRLSSPALLKDYFKPSDSVKSAAINNIELPTI
jgi:integrase